MISRTLSVPLLEAAGGAYLQRRGLLGAIFLVFVSMTLLHAAQGVLAEIRLSGGWQDGNLSVHAEVADDRGLGNVTFYILDEVGDVLWMEKRSVSGTRASLTFLWPVGMWRVSNGTHFAEPVLVSNSGDPGVSGSQLMAYYAPCLLGLSPKAQEISTLAYFDGTGRFHTLIDLSGKEYYRSPEMLRIENPRATFGSYAGSGSALQEGLSSLRFVWLNREKGMNTFPALLLNRSPIQRYALSLERIAAGPGPFLVEIEAEDQEGNKAVGSSGPWVPELNLTA